MSNSRWGISILPMPHFQPDGTIRARFLFHHVEPARAHFVHQLLVNILLHHGLAEFLTQSPQFILAPPFTRHTQRCPAPRILRKGNSHAVTAYRNPLVPPQLAGHHLCFRFPGPPVPCAAAAPFFCPGQPPPAPPGSP